MKLNILPILIFAVVAILGCQPTQQSNSENQQQQEGLVKEDFEVAAEDGFEVTILGKLIGGEKEQVYFDQVFFNNQANPIEKANIDSIGVFELNVSNLKAGIYRLRIKDQRIMMIFDGSESTITINAELKQIPNLIYEINGSTNSSLYKNIGRQLFALSRKSNLKEANIQEMVDTTSNPLVSALWANTVLPPAQILVYPNPEDILTIHETAIKKISAVNSDSRYVQDYLAVLSPARTQLAMQKIRVGVQAPDISLPSPDGKIYSLSDLRGKVVLLDFWASWCRPCRMNNPEVVRIYNKYKYRGFTVFSVSLDGLDEMTKRRFGGDEVRAAQFVEMEKQKWQNAIKQDNLTWKYHVSDLKKWDCAPAKDYGVTGIPKTFLLDKEGKIVAIDPHRTNSLEIELERLL